MCVVVSFIYPQQERASWVPGEPISKQRQLRHACPVPFNCCLPEKSQTTLSRVWIPRGLSFPVSLFTYTSFSPSFACLKQDGQGMAKELKTNQIILKKLFTDLDEDQPRSIYLKWGLGRNLWISFKLCLLDNKACGIFGEGQAVDFAVLWTNPPADPMAAFQIY